MFSPFKASAADTGGLPRGGEGKRRLSFFFSVLLHAGAVQRQESSKGVIERKGRLITNS